MIGMKYYSKKVYSQIMRGIKYYSMEISSKNYERDEFEVLLNGSKLKKL